MPDKIFPDILQNALWHTTNLERFHMIFETGFILPNPPNIPESKKWGTGAGVSSHPYIRSLGGVSLFEFNNFDPVCYGKTHPMSTWQHFIPYKSSWVTSVWIEVDREQVADNFLNAEDLVDKWSKESITRTIMPRIEAACLVPIPIGAFRQVLTVGKNQPDFKRYP